MVKFVNTISPLGTHKHFGIIGYMKVCSCALCWTLCLHHLMVHHRILKVKIRPNLFFPLKGETINRSGWNLMCKRIPWVYSHGPNLALISELGVGRGAPQLKNFINYSGIAAVSCLMGMTVYNDQGEIWRITCKIQPWSAKVGIGATRFQNFVKICILNVFLHYILFSPVLTSLSPYCLTGSLVLEVSHLQSTVLNDEHSEQKHCNDVVSKVIVKLFVHLYGRL